MANLLPIVAFWFCHLPSFSHCQVKIPFFFSHPTLYCHLDLTSLSSGPDIIIHIDGEYMFCAALLCSMFCRW